MAEKKLLVDKNFFMAKEYGATRLILFGSAIEDPTNARDLDIACDGIQGWKLYEFASKFENDTGILLDIVPLPPPSSLTRYIEKKGKILI